MRGERSAALNEPSRISGHARARRLANLLAGTALASMGFAGEARAACTVAAGAPNSVNCLANTTTTNTANLNGATAASSDRIQEFNNGAKFSPVSAALSTASASTCCSAMRAAAILSS